MAARRLVGTRAEEDTLAALAEACSAVSTPMEDKRGTVEFRKHVAGVLAHCAAKLAYERAVER